MDPRTSVCERLFSNMNIIKNNQRSCFTNDNLQSCVEMKVTSYSPDVKALCAEVQEQKSNNYCNWLLFFIYRFYIVQCNSQVLLFRWTLGCTL